MTPVFTGRFVNTGNVYRPLFGFCICVESIFGQSNYGTLTRSNLTSPRSLLIKSTHFATAALCSCDPSFCRGDNNRYADGCLRESARRNWTHCCNGLVCKTTTNLIILTIHYVPKSHYLSRYNSDIHKSILIILAQVLLRKQAVKMYFIFPPHLPSASALSGEMKKDKNSILSLKCCTVALPDFNQLLA